MNAIEAIALLVKMADLDPEVSDAGMLDALVQQGMDPDAANQAVLFTVVAFGRVYLDTLNVSYSQRYLEVTEDGDIKKIGLLDENPYYIVAHDEARAAYRDGRRALFVALACRSMDVERVNRMLESGSDPQELELGPAVFHGEDVSELGMQKIEECLKSIMDSDQEVHEPQAKNPWWRFW